MVNRKGYMVADKIREVKKKLQGPHTDDLPGPSMETEYADYYKTYFPEGGNEPEGDGR